MVPVRRLRSLANHAVPQPLVGIGVVFAAAVSLAAVVIERPQSVHSAGIRDELLILYLLAALVLAQQFPIHVRHKTKVCVTSVVLYLTAVLLAPPLAALVTCLGELTGEVIAREQRGTYPSDIATQVGRMTFAVLLASLAARVPITGSTAQSLPLVLAAVVLWSADVITAPLLLTPATGEPPLQIIRSLIREIGGTEAVEYAMGLLVAMAARQDILSLAVLVLPTGLIYAAFKRAYEIDRSTRQMLERMADTVDLRDPYTGGHSRRVAELVKGTLVALNIRGPEVDLIVAAGRLHDIGKIGIPDDILKKLSGLTDAERAIMNTHPEAGAELLQRYPSFHRGADMVRHHHEHWDGQGYPHRLKGTEIPFGARVIAVADTFDAMTSDRPYRPGMSPQQAADVLRQGRGVQWDGAIVDAFLASIADRLEQPSSPALRVLPSAVKATGPGFTAS